MRFDTTQTAYRDLREVVAQRTDPIIAWVGAGLSASAGLPSWAQLKQSLLDELRQLANRHRDTTERHALLYAHGLANVEKNYWEAFSILKDNLGAETYSSAIRRAMSSSDRTPVPEAYKELWKLGIRGMLSLNIDRFAKRAFSEAFPGMALHDFDGTNVGQHIHLQRSGHPWLAHLHGQLDDRSSWVFTTSDLRRLFDDKGYETLISGSLTTRTVVFLGITADDLAAGGHLANLTRKNIDCGGHFWITHRQDRDTRDWAEKAGLRLINYAADKDHAELLELIADLRQYTATDDEPAPVIPAIPVAAKSLSTLPDPAELTKQTSSEIREILNAHAAAILKDTTSESATEFERFAQKYEDAIYRGWRVTTKEPNNLVFGYKILERVKEGAFGTVFRAEAPDGTHVAIKVLHERIREDLEMLHCFRRGVKSMKILTDQSVRGVVRCYNASEIPALVVMDFIEGIDLQDAVEKGTLRTWKDVLFVASELVSVIRASHRLPQRVLHRDIRPANIMLEHCWGPDPQWDDVKLRVLDFDLSWHIDGFDVSVTQPGAANGYLSPEQAERNPQVSTRNAAVDSFGTGMTLFFIGSGSAPRFGEQRYADWKDTLTERAHARPCREWRSLPKRYYRLVFRATLNNQADRLDMAQIENEIEILKELVREPHSVRSAEVLAEEIAARVSNLQYEWCPHGQWLTLPQTHMPTRIGFDEQRHLVRFEFTWFRNDFDTRKNVKKWLPNATDKAAAALRGNGWEVEIDRNPETPSIRAEISISKVREVGIDNVTAGVTDSIQSLTF